MFLINLWDRILSDDRAAWGELVARYSGLVFSTAIKIGLSNIDAEDCTQQTWISLYKNRRSIKDPVALPAWLILTTKRHAVKILKKIQKQSNSPFDITTDSNSLPPDEILLKLELQDAVEHAVEQLEPRCRKLFTLLFLSSRQYSYGEIAKILGVTPNNLGSVRTRCLNKLAVILKKMGYLEH
ncbi:MAG: sigma-70 family RNA polymerase sigma factor [Candidatus Zixiibacteriota bacterium]